MKFKVVGNVPGAGLVDGKPVANFTISLRAPGAALDFMTSDEALAKKYVVDASLEVDVSPVEAPPKETTDE